MSSIKGTFVKALLVADSPEFDLPLVERLATRSQLVVVTDGAVHKLGTRVAPHIVCGDFDSIDMNAATTRYPAAQFLALPDQYKNDLEKAIVYLIDKGASEIAIACSMGGRFDQAAANLAVAIRYHHQVPITIHQGDISMRVVSNRTPAVSELSFFAAKDGVVSTIAVERSATVSLSNVQWPLAKATLEPGSMGVSNRGLGEMVRVEVHDGIVLVFYSDGVLAQ
jgi:thiamine pyrophosphokinase